MAKDSDLNSTLKKKIQSLSTDTELLDKNLSERKVKSDFAIEVINILRSVLSESSDADLDTLEANKARITQLMSYTQQAKLGKREMSTLLASIVKVDKFVDKKISEKNSILKMASNIVEGWTENAGAMIENAMSSAFANDPLVNMATGALTRTGGFLKGAIGKRLASRANQKGIKNSGMKSDAASLLGKAVKPDRPRMPPPIPDQPQSTPGSSDGSGGDGGSLGNVENILNSISVDIKGLVSLNQVMPDIQRTLVNSETLLGSISQNTQSAISLIQDMIEELSYANMENERERVRRTKIKEEVSSTKTSTGDEGGESSLKKILQFAVGSSLGQLLMAMLRPMVGGAIALGGALMSPPALIGMAIALATVDGIRGWLKGPEWKVSNIAGAIGAFFGGAGNSAVTRTLAGMGKFAVLGGVIGTMAAPGIGTAIGGLIGAMLGGLLGWIGGAKIAQFFNEFGIWVKETFTNAIDELKNFFSDMWDSIKIMFLDFGNIMDQMKIGLLDWSVKLMQDVIKNDPTGVAGFYLYDDIGSAQIKMQDTKGRIANRLAQRDQLQQDQVNRQAQFKENIRKQEQDRKKRLIDYDGANNQTDTPSGEKVSLSGNKVSIETLDAMKRASNEFNVDMGYMLAVGGAESGFDRNAKGSGSTARGMYQFIGETGRTYAAKLGIAEEDILKPESQSRMAAAYAADNRRALEPVKRGPVTSTDLYLGHFLGTEGAKIFLTEMYRNGNALAKDIFPKFAAISGNKNLFYKQGDLNQPRTLDELYGLLDRKAGPARSRIWSKEYDKIMAARISPSTGMNGSQFASNTGSSSSLIQAAQRVGSDVSGLSALWAVMKESAPVHVYQTSIDQSVNNSGNTNMSGGRGAGGGSSGAPMPPPRTSSATVR